MQKERGWIPVNDLRPITKKDHRPIIDLIILKLKKKKICVVQAFILELTKRPWTPHAVATEASIESEM